MTLQENVFQLSFFKWKISITSNIPHFLVILTNFIFIVSDLSRVNGTFPDVFLFQVGLHKDIVPQPNKMVKQTQKICQLLPMNCLSLFDHFVALALKGLSPLLFIITLENFLEKLSQELQINCFMLITWIQLVKHLRV